MGQDKKTTDIGAIIGIIIVVIVLLVGAFYVVGQRIQKQKEFQASIQQAGVATTAVSINEISDTEKNASSTSASSSKLKIK